MAKLVTIFGASGFVGRHTVRAFARAGWRIRAVTRAPNLSQYLLPMGSVGQIQLFKGDVHDEDRVAQAVEHADAVVNLVGILYQSGHNTFEDIHAEAPGAIAKAAKAAGATSFAQVSAIGADAQSDSAYARTKAQGEAAVKAAFPDAAILRPSIVFGPEDDFFNRFAAMARLSPVLPLIGGGHTKFQPVFVGDVAAAILKCTENRAFAGRTYELGGPGVYTFKELMQFILTTTERKRLLVPVPFAIAMLKSYVLGMLPKPLLTPDQVRQLRHDNVVHAGMATLADLGIAPESIEAEVPAYLWRFRRAGQYQITVNEETTATP